MDQAFEQKRHAFLDGDPVDFTPDEWARLSSDDLAEGTESLAARVKDTGKAMREGDPTLAAHFIVSCAKQLADIAVAFEAKRGAR